MLITQTDDMQYDNQNRSIVFYDRDRQHILALQPGDIFQLQQNYQVDVC